MQQQRYLQPSELVAFQAEQRPDAAAILAPNRSSLSYSRLNKQISQTVAALHSMGIGRNDRVVLVLPEGPELAVAHLAVASCATSVPLNPAFNADEFAFYLSAIKARTLIVQAGTTSPAISVAHAANIPIIELCPALEAEAGIFTLAGQKSAFPTQASDAQPDDIVLILTSSGTTSRPKLIPLTYGNFHSRLDAGQSLLNFTERDCLLNIMPMFHSTGLASLAKMMSVAGSIVCLPGFDSALFFDYLDEFRPTWLTAVTTLYQTIIARAATRTDVEEIVARGSLRFIRSNSMALPLAVTLKLERIFKVPVVQCYGTTEGGLIALNPLPPRIRKPTSVGIIVAQEVAIFDEAGSTVPAGSAGEIAVRSPAVVPGYENDPEANAVAFKDGWFRTGDIGYLDNDGYLFLTGRLKEVINRAGEKISPSEIEKVLLDHPSVAQAVAFGMPDTRLGEEVAAAIVLREGQSTTEKELQTFATARLAPFKVPRRIVFLDEIPKNDLGKWQRIGLAKRLGLAEPAPLDSNQGSNQGYSGPRTPLEQRLTEIWANVLGYPTKGISIHDDFQRLGGDSLAAVRLVTEVRASIHETLALPDFFDSPTIAGQAEVIEALIAGRARSRPSLTLVPIQPHGSRLPLFCTHVIQGSVYMYKNLLPYLDADQPVYGLLAPGLEGGQTPPSRLEDLIDHHLAQIRTIQTEGPYLLCGYSFGGRVALEIARRLREDSQQEAFVFIIDDQLQVNAWQVDRSNISLLRRMNSLLFALLYLPRKYQALYLNQKITAIRRAILGAGSSQTRTSTPPLDEQSLPSSVQAVRKALKAIAKAYIPRPYDGPITYLRARDDHVSIPLFKVLRDIDRGNLDIVDIPGNHRFLFNDPQVKNVGTHLRAWLNKYSPQVASR